MYEKIKSVLSKWWIALILGILLIAAGVWMLQNPGDAVGVLAKVLVVVFILTGIYSVFYVLDNKKNIPAWGWDLAAAIIMVVVGIALLFAPVAQLGLVGGMFAAGVLLMGINSIESSIAFKKMGVKTWWLTLIIGILNIIAAFMLAFNPVLNILTLGTWAGIATILKGVEFIVVSIAVSKVNSAVKNAENEVKNYVEETRKEYEEGVQAVKEAVKKEYGVDVDKAAEEIKKAVEDAGKEEK